MTDDTDPLGPKIARGLVAGVVAGAVASFAMDRFQAAVTALSSSEAGGGSGEPATVQAADGIAARTVGHNLPDDAKPLAGQAIHYALGMAMGAAYGIAAEFRPGVTAGYGTGFALGTATLLDQAAVPAVGLGDPVWKAGAATTLYSYASHIVFGGVTEWVRSSVRATLVPTS